ncbi:AraC family transcriptional regulator [Chitinophaga solisilvae]|uniref:AraC family transcriptional regulator n=1 Tax=Chitinophaga solisilvae TaxID=1233460 RepID=UPI00136BE475|nr:helix-turn-helix domain-containing protein [Chitinophaga solisilvae]
MEIRQLFKPVQPSVRNDLQGATYTELLPDVRLMKYIYCYWQLTSAEELKEPFYYRVVADGCMDIFYNTDKPDDNYIMGFSTTYTEFPLENRFNYIGIRFLPAAFPLLFRVNAGELTNRFEQLQQVVPALSRGIARIAAGQVSLPALQPLLDQYFMETISGKDLQADHRLFEAIDLILQAKGVLNVESSLDTGISPRQLRRLFEFYIGDTPKTFSKVVRFQHILQAKPSLKSLRENKLFYDAGYYDQAHFIKEFKTMYGLTPTIALREK